MPRPVFFVMIVNTPELERWRGGLGRVYTWTSLLKVPTRATQFREILSGRSYGRILEVGCNVGHNLDDLQFTGARLHGLDPYAPALYPSRRVFLNDDPDLPEILRPYVGWTEYSFDKTLGTAFALPYADRSFDLVLAAGVLCHVAAPDLGEAISELFRVGKSVLIVDYFSEVEVCPGFRDISGVWWARNFFSEIQQPPVKFGTLIGFDRTRSMAFGLWEG